MFNSLNVLSGLINKDVKKAQQFIDEFSHIYRYVLETIEQPPVEFGTPKALFQKVLEHEQKVTALIHKLYEQAIAEKDYRTQIMLQWFVTEQMEEEENAQEILSKLEMVGDKMNAIMWIDKELKKRGE